MTLKINDLLKEKGVSQENLAKQLGVNRVTLNRSINGNPTYDTLIKIANALDVDIRDLFHSTKEMEPVFKKDEEGNLIEIGYLKK